VDFGGFLELIDKKFPGWMIKSLLAVLWLAAIGAGFHFIYIYLGAPILRSLTAHDFASIIHLSSKIWIDVLVMLGLLVFILIVSVCSAFLVIWFLLAVFIAPIFKAFQRTKTAEEGTATEKPAPHRSFPELAPLHETD